jgi:RNase P subunit RPR2
MAWQLTCKACGLPFRLSEAAQPRRSAGSPSLITVECPLCHAISDYGALDLQRSEHDLAHRAANGP